MTGWELAEDTLVPTLLPWKESLFTISNGYLGTRGTFEEGIAGETQGHLHQWIVRHPTW